jgi:hypothetical protein
MQIDEGHIFIFVLVGLGLGVRCICLYAYIKGMDVKWLRLKRHRITRGVDQRTYRLVKTWFRRPLEHEPSVFSHCIQDCVDYGRITTGKVAEQIAQLLAADCLVHCGEIIIHLGKRGCLCCCWLERASFTVLCCVAGSCHSNPPLLAPCRLLPA